MTLRYTVLGAGAMGLRFGVLLQENAGAQVDLSTTGHPKLKPSKNKVGSMFLVTMKIGIWFRSISIRQKSIRASQTFLSFCQADDAAGSFGTLGSFL